MIEKALEGVAQPTSARAHPFQVMAWENAAFDHTSVMFGQVELPPEFLKRPTELYVYGVFVKRDSTMPKDRLEFLIDDQIVASIKNIALPVFAYV